MAVESYRPTSTDSTFGTFVTQPTSQTFHTVVDDEPAVDSTYVTSQFTGAGAKIGIANITLAGNERILKARMRARGFHNSADSGHYDQVDFRIHDSVTAKEAVVWPFRTYSNTVVELGSAWYSADPNGKAWDAVRFNRQQLTLAWQCRVTGLTQARITEVYFDADVRTQPAVSAVTVTGTTTTTRPGFSYTYTDIDGDGPQVRREVRVFTVAQASAVGFDPATGSPVWTSGQESTSDTTGAVGVDLIDQTAYVVWVRAARSWSGPAGTLWWSAYVASSNFTMTLQPPPVPGLTGTVYAEQPGHRAVLTVEAPTNLLSANESDFEGGIDGWSAEANCNVATTTTTPASGVNALSLTSVAGGDMVARSGLFATSKRVVPGRQYFARVPFRSAVSARSVAAGIKWHDAAGATISLVYGSNVTDSTSAYTVATATLTAPATAYSATLLAKVVATGAANEVHRIDTVALYAGTLASTYTPGGFRTDETVLVERGERVDDGRGPMLNWAHPQVATGGTAQLSTAGFRASSPDTDRIVWEPVNVAWPKALGAQHPGGAIAWRPRSGAASTLYAGRSAVDLELAERDTYPYQFPVVAGQSHVVSAVLYRGDGGTFAVTIKIEWLDAALAVLSSATSGTQTVTATPQRFTWSATAPANAVYAWAIITNSASAAAGDVYLTQVGWGLGATSVDDRPPSGGPLAWSAVRDIAPGSSAAVPIGEKYPIVDYELPPMRPVVYRARTLTLNSNGESTGSLYSTPITAYLAAPSRTLLIDPFQPERAVEVKVWPGDEGSLSTDATELHPMGDDFNPVVLRSWSGRARTLEVSAVDHADFAALVTLLDSARSLLWKWPEGGSEFLLTTGWSYTRTRVGYYRSVSVQTLTTSRPV